MDIQKIHQYKSAFDLIAKAVKDDDGNNIEVWYARELQEVLGYARWENSVTAVGRAIESCKTLGINVDDHFREVTKMIALAKGAQREVQDFMLTRYACYLIAQNGDPKKEEIAFAQSYFAVQTRKAELIEERLNEIARLNTRERLRTSEKQLSRNIFQRGVDDRGFGRIRSKGDQALFNIDTNLLKRKYNVPASRPLADFLPTVSIKAKDLAAEMTSVKTQIKNLFGQKKIEKEHVDNNRAVRKMLLDRGIVPENLPASEDVKKVARRLKRTDGSLLHVQKKKK